MAAADWLISSMLASIKRRGLIPASQQTYDEADLLLIATEVQNSYCVPFLRSVNEEFMVRSELVTLVAGTASYRIPKRASGEAMRDVLIADAQGQYLPMVRIDPTQALTYRTGFYFLEDDRIVLCETPTAAGTIKVKYWWRPNKLVSAERAFSLSSASVSRLNLTLAAVEADSSETVETIFAAGDYCELISKEPGFRSQGNPLLIDVISSPDLDLFSAVPAGVDLAQPLYVCLEGETPVPQFPADVHPWLSQAIVCEVVGARDKKDGEGAMKKLERLEESVRTLLGRRTQSQAPRIMNFHAPGWRKLRRPSQP